MVRPPGLTPLAASYWDSRITSELVRGGGIRAPVYQYHLPYVGPTIVALDQVQEAEADQSKCMDGVLTHRDIPLGPTLPSDYDYSADAAY
jgi:hypothetical protein